jgi:hypothetical protein
MNEAKYVARANIYNIYSKKGLHVLTVGNNANHCKSTGIWMVHTISELN